MQIVHQGEIIQEIYCFHIFQYLVNYTSNRLKINELH